ncbi:hypothetical protein SUNI508_13528 [Seiridium unicorne]|uniref:Uncharacterized protein n=1 Tax=Seiridium unicorne TaxID=138068 RepID=A0ABR2VCV7_9PEZI
MAVTAEPILATLAAASGVYFHDSIGPNGTVSPGSDTTLGPEAVGIIIYSVTGWMNMNQMASVPEYRHQDLTWSPQDN